MCPGTPMSFPLLDQLPDLRWIKVSPMLMTREGPALTHELMGRGLKVFLDLKWHDIPNTVAGANCSPGDRGRDGDSAYPGWDDDARGGGGGRD
jgi:orotidine-5'-phosphate decarboxylase